MIAPYPVTRSCSASSSWSIATRPSRLAPELFADATRSPRCYRVGVVNPPLSPVADAVNQKIAGLLKFAALLFHRATE